MAGVHHGHQHGDAEQSRSSGRSLVWAVVLTAGFAVVEAVGGWLSGSLALLSDAGHMVTDSAGLAIGAMAAVIARKSGSRQYTFGLQRAEIVGALINAVFMIGVVGYIIVEAVQRLAQPQPVFGGMVMAIAAIGLLINIGAAWVLHSGEQTMNVRGAMLHVIGDLLGSVGALLAGGIIYYTGWLAADPLLSLLIAALILISSLRLLREVLHVFLEKAPSHLDIEEIGRALAAIPGVHEVHDLHVWTLSSGRYSLSAHLRLENMKDWPRVLAGAREALAEHFGIEHVTLQPELMGDVAVLPLPKPP